jgi:hypothetical protein
MIVHLPCVVDGKADAKGALHAQGAIIMQKAAKDNFNHKTSEVFVFFTLSTSIT